MREGQVLAERRAFSRMRVWGPQPRDLNPEGWLGNFSGPDRTLALHLLNAFVFFNQEWSVQLSCAAYRRISRDFHRCAIEPNSLVQTPIWTFPTGEVPNATDSGQMWTRLVTRQSLEVPQARIMEPLQALRYLFVNPGTDIVFIDDFMGSGNQFLDTWGRVYDIGGVTYSFQEHFERASGRPYLVCSVATKGACGRLGIAAPAVHVSAGHVLGGSYRLTSPTTHLVPAALRSDIVDLVRRTSSRIGVPAQRIYGFRGLALTVAFEHCIPDATLPIFYEEAPGWEPLMHRR